MIFVAESIGNSPSSNVLYHLVPLFLISQLADGNVSSSDSRFCEVYNISKFSDGVRTSRLKL